MQINQGVFRFLRGKAAAQNVRNGVHVEFVLNGRANADGSRPFAGVYLLQQTVGVLLVNEFLPVAGDVDELGVKLHQPFDVLEEAVDGGAFYGGEDFKTEQGFALGGGDVVGYFHGEVRIRYK